MTKQMTESWTVTAPSGEIENSFLDDTLRRHMERSHQIEPTIRAFVEENGRQERIKHEIETLHQRFKDNVKPALYGLPIAIKDVFHIEGLPTQAGSTLPPASITGKEGSLIRSLREQGAWIAGKTVTEEFAYGGRPIPTRNPYNIDCAPGGSSAGSAAAVASGMSPVAIGTQTLRSVMAPASFCGVTGFKPSYDRVPVDGVIALSPSFDTAGIFTKDAASMSAVAPYIVPDWKSPTTIDPSFDAERKPVLGIPNGVYMNLMFDGVRNTFEEQVALLKQNGYSVISVDVPWEDQFIYGDDMLHFLHGEMARVHEQWFEQHKEYYSSSIVDAILQGRTIEDETLERYRQDQVNIRSRLAEYRQSQGIDLWISPAQGGVAPLAGGRSGWAGMNAIWSYAGLPTISLPGGLVDGLPIGLQCIAEYGQDEILLYHAEQIARLL